MLQVHEATIEAGAYPSPLNYHSFPKSVCTSVNEARLSTPEEILTSHRLFTTCLSPLLIGDVATKKEGNMVSTPAI